MSEKYIRVDQPRNFDIVGNPIQIAGVGTGFEATFQYRIHEGHDEVSSYIMAGGGTGEIGQFQKKVDVSRAAFKLPRLFVEVFEVSMNDGSERNKVTKEVLYGPGLVKGYYGYRLHTVKKGETLYGIGLQHYGDGIGRVDVIKTANLKESNTIVPGEVLRIPIGS
jgi:nucleoid-associated protein YgaU